MQPCTKRSYTTQAEAEKAIRALKKNKRIAGGGHALRKLNAFLCPDCHQWHTGHSSREGVKPFKIETHKIPSVGQLRRKAARLQEKMDGEKRHLAYVLGEIIKRDAQRDYEEALSAIYGEAIPEDLKGAH